MNEIINIAIAVLLFGVVLAAAVLALLGIKREIDRQNKQRRQAVEDEARRKKACRDELFEWHARVSAGWPDCGR